MFAMQADAPSLLAALKEQLLAEQLPLLQPPSAQQPGSAGQPDAAAKLYQQASAPFPGQQGRCMRAALQDHWKA